MNNFLSNYANTPNPITKFFNKINCVELDGIDDSRNIEWLKAMKKVPLYVKWIEIKSDNAEELENLTDPNLHNTPIGNLQWTLFNSFEISSKTIENLKATYPNSISLCDYSKPRDETTSQVLLENISKLLSKLDHTSLVMDFDRYNYWIKLEFIDVIFKVVESNEEYSYIRAKSVETSCADDDFCWIK